MLDFLPELNICKKENPCSNSGVVAYMDSINLTQVAIFPSKPHSFVVHALKLLAAGSGLHGLHVPKAGL